MSKCRRCRIEVLDEANRCPLCHSVLELNEEMEDSYPDIVFSTRKQVLFSRIYLFVAIVVTVLLSAINYIWEFQTWWSLIFGLMLLYGYLVIKYAIIGKSGYISKIIVLCVNAILLLVAIDYIDGFRGWSVDYILPVAIILIDMMILLLIIFNRRNWQSYIMLQIAMLVASFIPIILCMYGVEATKKLAAVSFFCSAFLLLGTIIIGGRRARLEIKRRFYIGE